MVSLCLCHLSKAPTQLQRLQTQKERIIELATRQKLTTNGFTRRILSSRPVE